MCLSAGDSPVVRQLSMPCTDAVNALGPMHPCRLYLRNERQTLRRLPRTGAVLFTIRTYTRHLREIADRPDLCARLQNSLFVTPNDFVSLYGCLIFASMILAGLAAVPWLEWQWCDHLKQMLWSQEHDKSNKSNMVAAGTLLAVAWWLSSLGKCCD